MPQPPAGAPRPFCIRYGGALSVPLVMAGAAALCVAAALAVAVLTTLLTRYHIRPGAHDEIYAFALVCDFLALWLLMGPAFAYVTVGQVKKLEGIRGFYTPALIAEYFDQFWSGRDGIADLVFRWRHPQPGQHDALAQELDAKFRDLVTEDFGGVYVIPALLLIAIGFLVLFFGFAGGIAYAEALWSKTLPPVMPLGVRLDLVSVAAIFGAYTWVASDSITRGHLWTFHPSDLVWYALRLLIAVPLGQAIAQTAPGAAGAGIGAFLAFVISMFSLDGIKKFLSAAAIRLGGSTQNTTPEERDDVVIRLAGVDEATADALRAEGVCTIAQLTAIDPVRTSIQTGLPFEYVLRLIDSAILWTFFRSKTDQLREFGLRGASGLLLYAYSMADAGLARVAGDFADAEAALRDQQDSLDRATAERDAARQVLGPNPIMLADAQRALQEILAQPDQDAAADRRKQMEAIIATLQHLQTCEATLATATAARETAAQAATDAAIRLRAASGRDALFSAIEAKSGPPAAGLMQAMAQLRADAYARFIQRLLNSA